MKYTKTSQKREIKTFKQLTELNKTAKMKKKQTQTDNPKFSLLPDVNMILDYIDNENYPTISSISRTFKIHRMTASEIVYKMKNEGLISINLVGTAKIIERV